MQIRIRDINNGNSRFVISELEFDKYVLDDIQANPSSVVSTGFYGQCSSSAHTEILPSDP
jgi:hypothetical protein